MHDIGQRQYLNELMKSIKGSPDEQLLKLALLKSLMRARYDTEPLGHYGLATPNYCHFTSPIRRYADLVVHRSLNPLLATLPKELKEQAVQAGWRKTRNTFQKRNAFPPARKRTRTG